MANHAQPARTMEALRARHVANPRDAVFASHLDRLLRRGDDGTPIAEAVRFSPTRETRGIMVVDGPGGGKSTLVAHALANHPVLRMGAHGLPAYLAVSVPSPATFKSMGLEMLRRSGYPDVAHRKEAWNIWEMLRTRLKRLGIVVLWIDEAHDLFCKDRDMILRALKALMQGDEAVIVILSGTERLADIIRSDPQVQRRFSTVHLPPVSVATDGDDFLELIEAYCGRAGLGTDLAPDLVERLFHGGRYRFGRCIEALLGAIERALDGRAAALTDQHFAEAWTLQEGHDAARNVFLARNWASIDLDHAEPHPHHRRPTRRRS